MQAALPFDALGGAEGVTALVNRFYDLMEESPEYAGLRALHAADLAPMRRGLTGFLTAWLGGPRDWIVARGGFCVMSAHGRLAITPEHARQWQAAMAEALRGGGADARLAAQLNEVFARMGGHMVNRAGDLL